MLARATPLLLALAFACSCEEEPRERCKIVKLEVGHELVCGDEAAEIIPVARPIVAGSIGGEATLFGLEDSSGIKVEVVGHSTHQTAADGSYLFEEMPRGRYQLRFTHPGYEPADRGSVLSLPGIHVEEDVLLRVGRRMHGGTIGQLIPSPRGDTFLALGEEAANLGIPERGILRPLGAVRDPSIRYSPDGSRVIFVITSMGERSDVLLIHDIGSGLSTDVADGVVRWELTPDGRTVVYHRNVVEEERAFNLLEVWQHDERRRSVLVENPIEWSVAPDGRSVAVLAGQPGGGVALVIWDVAAASGAAFPGVAELPEWSKSGRTLYFHQNEPHIFDTRTGQMLRPGHGSFLLSDDGMRVVHNGPERLQLFRVADGSRQEITAAGVRGFRISPDGKRVAYERIASAGRSDLLLYDEEKRISELVVGNTQLLQFRFSPDGERLYFLDEEGLKEYVGGVDVLLSAAPQWDEPDLLPEGYIGWHDGDEYLVRAYEGGQPLSVARSGFGELGPPTIAIGPGGAHLAVIDGSRRLRVWDLSARTELDLSSDSSSTPAAIDSSPFAADGSLFFLRRVQSVIASPRGELMRLDPSTGEETVIGRAALTALRKDLDGKRLTFVGEGPPVGQAILWLLDRPDAPPLPVDADVAPNAHLVGSGWVAFVRRNDDVDETGLYFSLYPRNLPAEQDIPAVESE